MTKRRRRAKTSLNQEGGYIFAGVVVFIIFTAAAYSMIRFFSADKFTVENYQVLGTRTIEDEKIVTASYALGENIFFLDNERIEQNLLSSFPYLRNTSVRKQWPDTILIKVTEQEPQLLLTTLNGAYLVDEDGKILEVVFQEKISFSRDRINLALGRGELAYPEVKQRIVAEWLTENPEIDTITFDAEEEGPPDSESSENPEDGNAKATSPEFEEETNPDINTLSFGEIPEEFKQIILRQMESENIQAADLLFTENIKRALEDVEQNLPLVTSYENQQYFESDMIDPDKVSLTNEAVKFFRQLGAEISRISWQGKFLVSIELQDRKTLIFGTERNLGYQFEDYLVVSNELRRQDRNYSRMDLSTRKISIK